MIIAINATAANATKPIHTLTSHILHSIHNQGIFTEFLVLPLLLSTFETLLPQALSLSILTVSDNCIDTVGISYIDSFFFYKLNFGFNTCMCLFVDNMDFVNFVEYCSS